MSGKTPDSGQARYLDADIDDPDNPEWTAADFARARPAREAMPAELFDSLMQATTADRLRYQIYRDQAGDYRWRLLGPGGELLAHGADGYGRKAEVVEAIDLIRSADARRSVVEEAA